jgi:DNA-binding transcriptional LysR family regulator
MWRNMACLKPRWIWRHSVLSVQSRPFALRHVSLDPVTINPVAPLVVNNVAWLRRFALLGLGIVAHAPDMLRDHLVRGALVPILPDWLPPPVPVYILTESRLQPARVRLFLDYRTREIDR